MAGGPTETTKPAEEYRLPTGVKAKHYDLTIRTDLEKLRFDGYVVAHLDVLEETSKIVFNSSKLTLGRARLSSAALKEEVTVDATSFEIDGASERVTIQLPGALSAGTQLALKVDFEGELTGSMLGYYRCSWEDEGKTKHYALTQFEPTSARAAFPCWDEPLLKATIALTMVSRADTVNLSNMPAISEEVYAPSYKDSTDAISWLSSKFSELTTGEGEKWKVTKFQTTPPMSTYIVAFANGPFVYLEDSYTSPLSKFALDVKKKVLPLYEQVFDIEYPLPKLDTLVATDFDAAAMENWGLITGATSAYLVEPDSLDLGAKKRIAVTQSHECAHMWFGNITTMEWWDNLYLNEGFASLPTTDFFSRVFPEWKVHSAFISEMLNRALSLDAKLSSHPIEVECPDAATINQIFDSLSYAKAASVLRMLSNFIGEEKFLKGVSIYLKKHLFANSVTKDLWEGIQEASGVDVPKVMDNWVKKMGFPVITVTETKDGITVRQDRFLETGPAPPEENETLWSVPLSLLTTDENGKAKIDRSLLLDQREITIALDTSKPFKLNAGTTGVYRVLYTAERLIAIAKEAAKENSIFSLEDRIGLVYDALALARAGYLDVSAVLSLYDVFRNEKEHLVWDSVAESFGVFGSTWYEHPQIVEKLNTFRRELFVPIVARLGYDYTAGESVDVHELRTTAIVQSAHGGDEGVIEELRTRFKKAIETGEDAHIPPDLLGATYVTSVKHGGKMEYDQVKAILAKPKTPTVELAAIAALCATQNDELAEETWKYLMSKSRDQDIPVFFRNFFQNHKKRHFLVDKFREDYDQLYQRLEGNFSLQYLVNYSHAGLCSDKDWKETKAFFEGKDVSKYKLALQQSLDGIHTRSEWIKRSTSDLQKWLENRK
ncbi:peptidase family M1-domain-containing protein [Irpex rosettiformis]|uniref:Peptidase family M1-domain-containing protein n=1 Tax=Irpex rosettiformis TaxID=378272 RepID=A0ACB8TXI1_9APHY|nr:peptidase family M1-domain-containing protein [Irpex rosettiformis]